MTEPGRGFDARALATPDKSPWLITSKHTLSYGELQDRTERLHGLLREHGLGKGNRVLVTSRDDVQTAWLAVALMRAGYAAVMLEPDLTGSEARFAVELARADGMIADRNLMQGWALERAPRHVFPLDAANTPKPNLVSRLLRRNAPAADAPTDGLLARLTGQEPLALTEPPPPESTAYVIFTSGTTGRPRGVEMSHRGLLAHLSTLERQMRYSTRTRLLNVLPLSHVDGLVQGAFMSYFVGGSCHRPCAFNAQNLGLLLDTVYAQRITHMIVVPTMLGFIARLGVGLEDSFATDDFEFVISAAGPLDAQLWSSFEDRFGTRIVNLYGLTETVTGGLFAGPDDASHRHGTVGKPVDCEARIVDDAGIDVDHDVEGELWLRGDNLMTGYLDDPEATRLAMPDGWLRTGDLATRDSQGFHRIVGRKKELIICGGMNISPQEVAEVLRTHAAVEDAAVIGIPDAQWGEIPVAAVVVRDPLISASDLASHCRTSLAPYKLPREVVFMDRLPRGRSGKVVAQELLARVQELRTGFDTAGDGSILDRVRTLAAERFIVSPSQLHADSSPANTAGWDSLAHMALVSAIEDNFGIRLSTRQIMSMESLGGTAAMVQELLQAR